MHVPARNVLSGQEDGGQLFIGSNPNPGNLHFRNFLIKHVRVYNNLPKRKNILRKQGSNPSSITSFARSKLSISGLGGVDCSLKISHISSFLQQAFNSDPN